MSEEKKFQEFVGKVYKVDVEKQITDTFKKREFVITVANDFNGKTYTDYYQLELNNNNCDKLDAIGVGEDVKVGYFISGRKYNPKKAPDTEGFFTTLKATYIQSMRQANHSQESVSEQSVNKMSEESSNYDNLPF